MLRVILFAILVPASTLAAQINTYVVTDELSAPAIIQLSGEIVEGDGEIFEALSGKFPKVTVLLDSPGGLVREALRIGATVRQRGFVTMVAANGKCYSACGLIWLASERRYMAGSSQIGFHAAYRKIGDYLTESGQANAEIGSYLTLIGFRVEAIRFFTRSGPSEIELLTPALARALGIDVYLLDGNRVIPPWENPTVDRIASAKVALMVAGSVCESMFGKPLRNIDEQVQALDAEGISIVGEFWDELWLREIDRYKPTGSHYTLAHACISAESAARQFGYRLFDGPSFDCSRAGTSTERVICSDVDLQAKDRVMSGLYFSILLSGNPKVQVLKLREFHADWLRRRNGCAGNNRCIHAAYDELLDVYGGINLDTSAR